jgi:hypothetical protein
MPNNIIKKDVPTQLLAAIDRKLTLQLPTPQPGFPRMVFAASDGYDCGVGSATAPLTGQSYDSTSFKIRDGVVTIIQPSVYLITGHVRFRLLDNPSATSTSAWGRIQQAFMSFRTLDYGHAPVAEATAFNGLSTQNEELIQFTQIFTTWEDNKEYVLSAAATFGHPSDHPVVIRAYPRLNLLRLPDR